MDRPELDRKRQDFGLAWQRLIDPDAEVVHEREGRDSSPQQHTIYVAKPGADMRAPYQRVVSALQRYGYVVVPEIDAEIPLDGAMSAFNFVHRALSQAKLSIHLLGEDAGAAPAGDDGMPIVPLQLKLAALRAAPDRGAAGGFFRLVWIPAAVPDENGEPNAGSRKPYEGVAGFDDDLNSDRAEGTRVIQRFLDWMFDTMRPLWQTPVNIIHNARIYHAEEDCTFAIRVARALVEQYHLRVTLSADPNSDNSKNGATVLCWGRAGESQVQALAALRPRDDVVSAVVLGPPPSDAKDRFKRSRPKGLHIVDLTHAGEQADGGLTWLARQCAFDWDEL